MGLGFDAKEACPPILCVMKEKGMARICFVKV